MSELDCSASRELVCACIDEELEPQVEASVHRHLAQCPGCAEIYHAQQLVKSLLRRSCADHAAAPPGLRDRIWATVVAQCHTHPAGETSVTVNRTRTTTVSTTANGVVVQRTTVTGTVVRASYRPQAAPERLED